MSKITKDNLAKVQRAIWNFVKKQDPEKVFGIKLKDVKANVFVQDNHIIVSAEGPEMFCDIFVNYYSPTLADLMLEAVEKETNGLFAGDWYCPGYIEITKQE